jgi:RNA polymerase sigma-70 factor (ECF subfamily)
VEQAEEIKALRDCLRSLPPERQELLVLKHGEGLPNAEIGRIMGRSEGAIKSLYYRTLITLKRDLSRKEGLLDESEA